MKHNRILSTAGICPSNSTKLRSYCNLMQGSLTDKWLFADDFVESHVCIVRDDYLSSIGKEKMDNFQEIIVINKSNKDLDYKYQITPPLTASKIKTVLNQISKETQFKKLNLTESSPKKAVNKFKAAFSSIRKNFFGKEDKKIIEIKNNNRDKFISNITNKIQSTKITPYKVVLLGSPGSGKTTAIAAASFGKALNSDVVATDSVANDKAKTTVGIDYAEIDIPSHDGEEQKISLFGTPGQIKFNFIWDVVGKNADGFIILLDMSRPEPLSYLKFYSKFLHDEIGNTSLVYCALTHCEKYFGDISNIMEMISSEYSNIKGVYRIDAREKEDVSIVLSDIYPQIKNAKEMLSHNTNSKNIVHLDNFT